MTLRTRDGKETLRPGSYVADRYRIRRVIGRGGSSVVYAAWDEDGEHVALKVLDPEPGHRVTERQRMLREARITGAMRHPGIVHMREAGELADGQAFLVMERLFGRTLSDRMNGVFWLPVEECLEVAAQLLAALDFAHSHGVVHRDVNPANVFLLDGETIQTKLIDFGIGRDLGNPQSRVTEPDVVVGTLGYMAPEQLFGEEPTVQTDVYGAGATIYEMLTGHPPHQVREGDVRKMLCAMIDPPVSLEKLRPAVPEPVATGVMRALSHEPQERWASVREMAEACQLLSLAAA